MRAAAHVSEGDAMCSMHTRTRTNMRMTNASSSMFGRGRGGGAKQQRKAAKVWKWRREGGKGGSSGIAGAFLHLWRGLTSSPERGGRYRCAPNKTRNQKNVRNSSVQPAVKKADAGELPHRCTPFLSPLSSITPEGWQVARRWKTQEDGIHSHSLNSIPERRRGGAPRNANSAAVLLSIFFGRLRWRAVLISAHSSTRS